MAIDKWVKRALLGAVAFSLLQIFFFRELWHWTTPIDGRRPFRGNSIEVLPASTFELQPGLPLKQWPTIASFKPWKRDPNLRPYTCEAYFGYGFTEEHLILNSSRNEEVHDTKSSLKQGKSFRCLYSQTLRTSICEGQKLVMNSDKIAVSRGGESIAEVIGRDEAEELPVFSEGAFQILLPRGGHKKLEPGAPLFDNVSLDKLMPAGKIKTHTMRSLLLNLRSVNSGNVVCAKRFRQPVVILTRFEYANLFHTATDWFSAYISSRIAGLKYRPHLVLLDGHCESPMDDGWKAMFSSVTYAKHFTGSVCFDHAILAPLGYDVPLFKYIESTLDCAGCSIEQLNRTLQERKTTRLREFGEFFATSFETKPMNSTAEELTVQVNRQIQQVNVLFVRRENYLAHPRHNGKPESRLSNEEEVLQVLKAWGVEKSTNVLDVTIVNGLLAHMTLAEQIQVVKKADVLIGAHGAGLTHLVFSKPTTVILELSSPMYKRPHFATMSYWMGMDYRVIEMDSSFANTDQVVKKMSEILDDVQLRKD